MHERVIPPRENGAITYAIETNVPTNELIGKTFTTE
jgi:hypothetical protein